MITIIVVIVHDSFPYLRYIAIYIYIYCKTEVKHILTCIVCILLFRNNNILCHQAADFSADQFVIIKQSEQYEQE